ncbi:unnamed protein product [Medioppia subpectinata]|uniref:Protein-tyrosine sulfotransferase n=1 Tax=Medioppia subpectinata TaxID=1979941 RepID=A0A7R9KF00_9ACAR|nr:unnamed protein product [Medioppia subpectinata]CAG2101129.1 unnamed protein product [Medioppia subpectinata]
MTVQANVIKCKTSYPDSYKNIECIFHIRYELFEDKSLAYKGRFIGSKNKENGDKTKKFAYNRYSPLVFIGGVPRSGTTFMRVLLDSHSDIRCGEETRVIPDLLHMSSKWRKSSFESQRLSEAGITGHLLDSVVADFILEIMVKHGTPAPRLCNKDPLALQSALYLRHLVPNSKLLLMIRDGRAVVHSIISRNVTIGGYDLNDFCQCLKIWNKDISNMHNQCQQLGSDVCFPVRYKQFGLSTDQVIKPINIEALSQWVGRIPDDVVRDMATIAPMLSILGYDPLANPPNYGSADTSVELNMKRMEDHKQHWYAKQQQIISIRQNLTKHFNW